MKSITILIPIILLLHGCAGMKEQFNVSSHEKKDFSRVDVKLDCNTETHRSIGRDGMKGVLSIVSGVGSITEMRGKETCISKPYERELKNF